jgi:hypothetical protein
MVYETKVLFYFSLNTEEITLPGGASLPASIVEGIRSRYRRQVKGNVDSAETNGGSGRHNSATHGSATHGSATHSSATHSSATHHRGKREAKSKKTQHNNSSTNSSSYVQTDSAEVSGSHGNGVPHGNSSSSSGHHRGKRESAAGKLLVSFG